MIEKVQLARVKLVKQPLNRAGVPFFIRPAAGLGAGDADDDTAGAGMPNQDAAADIGKPQEEGMMAQINAMTRREPRNVMAFLIDAEYIRDDVGRCRRRIWNRPRTRSKRHRCYCRACRTQWVQTRRSPCHQDAVR